jgi:acetyltransferase-like isoleucine patch superfamily enzyme
MISPKAQIGKNVVIKAGVIIEDNVVIGDSCYLDYGCILREGVTLGANSYVGPQSILGEFQMDFHRNRETPVTHQLIIDSDALIRSHCVIYGGSNIGAHFQTGHHVTVRENTTAGQHWRVGTLSDIQGNCKIGDYVNMHSNVHIGMYSKIGNYVWIFPYCVFTNDPIPPSELQWGCTAEDYSVIATGSILLPGVNIGEGAFVGAGSIVTHDVPRGMVAVGSPAKLKSEVSQLKNPVTLEPAYPWPLHYSKGMPWEKIGYEMWKGN